MDIILIIGLLVSIAIPIYFSSMEVFKNEIEGNITYLKQEKWFQAYLSNEAYHKLILENKRVRRVIGLINTKKMSQPTYHKAQQKRLKRS